MGHHGFITAIESWGSGGSELDVVTLKDGAVMMITDSAIVLFADRTDFEWGRGGRVLPHIDDAESAAVPDAADRPRLRAVN